MTSICFIDEYIHCSQKSPCEAFTNPPPKKKSQKVRISLPIFGCILKLQATVCISLYWYQHPFPKPLISAVVGTLILHCQGSTNLVPGDLMVNNHFYQATNILSVQTCLVTIKSPNQWPLKPYIQLNTCQLHSNTHPKRLV